MPLPLKGLFVADFTRVLAGPLCTQMLADAGATVVKVEEPERGDETRRWGPPFLDGVSTYFLSINRNKRSLALDMRRGREVVRALVARADVVIDNFLPRQRKELGLADVRRRNRRAVHCRIAGFDPDTPEADRPGYDLLAQAGAGLMSITGEPDGSPMKSGVALSDVLTAHHAYGAICTALVARERTGRGATIDISLFSATLASLINVAQGVLATGKDARRLGNQHPSIVPYQLFRGSDRSFAVGAGTDRHFRALCAQVVGSPELAEDPRYTSNTARVANRDALTTTLQAAFETRKASFWVARCHRAAVPASLVRTVGEALATSAAEPLIATLQHPRIGAYQALRTPAIHSGKRLPAGSAPPLLGQHTAAVLRELGFDAKRIRELRVSGIIGLQTTSAGARGRKRG